MLVKDIMQHGENLVKVSLMASVREALTIMKEHNVKSLIVDKSHESDAYGIITYTSILSSIVAEDGDIDLLNVYDVCSKPALQISKELDVKYAAKLMLQQDIKRILVVSENELEGIITMDDMVSYLMDNIH